MRKYCKAYYMRDLRKLSGWAEHYKGSEPELPDNMICYLWDDFTVIVHPSQEESMLFDEISPQWQDFCREALKFDIPDDLRYAYKQSQGDLGPTETDSNPARKAGEPRGTDSL